MYFHFWRWAFMPCFLFFLNDWKNISQKVQKYSEKTHLFKFQDFLVGCGRWQFQADLWFKKSWSLRWMRSHLISLWYWNQKFSSGVEREVVEIFSRLDVDDAVVMSSASLSSLATPSSKKVTFLKFYQVCWIQILRLYIRDLESDKLSVFQLLPIMKIWEMIHFFT